MATDATVYAGAPLCFDADALQANTWVDDRVRGGRSKLHREQNTTALVEAVLCFAGRHQRPSVGSAGAYIGNACEQNVMPTGGRPDCSTLFQRVTHDSISSSPEWNTDAFILILTSRAKGRDGATHAWFLVCRSKHRRVRSHGSL